jgi:ectoine hydroxylase-related dioxygenase (phytanoyl-CoA dioxygenase family)
MNAQCLDHTLTEQERVNFERDGYILLPGALGVDNARHFASVLDDVDGRYRQQKGLQAHERANMHDAIGADERFLELIDWPTTFPKVWGLMGWNIQLYHTQMVVSPPPAQPSNNGQKASLGWHQDNNRMNRDMEVALQPMVSLKVLYFLSDIPTVGMGNFYVAPSSQTVRDYERDSHGNPLNALPITARAGDALIFDRRLWHAASPNTAAIARKVLFYGYSYRWLRPKCDMDVSKVWEESDPIRRQLLGGCTNSNGYYDPKPEDVPLRGWLQEHLPADQIAV